VFVGVCIGFGLHKDIVEVMLVWLGPTLLLLPFLFWQHRHEGRADRD
jgi:hypothetical protein